MNNFRDDYLCHSRDRRLYLSCCSNLLHFLVMEPRRKLIWCLIGNTAVLLLVVLLVALYANENEYWRVGPNDSLLLLYSVRVDTWPKYVGVLAVLALVGAVKVAVEDTGMPILGFSIYNPEKTEISEFSKNELQFYANSMYLISALRESVLVLVTISQADFAFWSILASQATSACVIHALLSEKRFPLDEPDTNSTSTRQDPESVALRIPVSAESTANEFTDAMV